MGNSWGKVPESTPASPICPRCRPVSTALRDGVEDGLAQNACVDRPPSRAMRSKAGVRTVRSLPILVSRHD